MTDCVTMTAVKLRTYTRSYWEARALLGTLGLTQCSRGLPCLRGICLCEFLKNDEAGIKLGCSQGPLKL